MPRIFWPCVTVLAIACSTRPDLPPSAAGDALPLGNAWVDADGATLGAGPASVTVGVAAYGRPGAMQDAMTPAARAEGDELHIERGHGVTEWWRELTAGLEQGVTFDERPRGEGPLVIEMWVGARTLAEDRPVGDIAIVDRTTGTTLASYGGLAVLDATGSPIDAVMHGDGGTIRIEVDDRDAVYPLVVDPVLQLEEATLLPSSGGAASQRFGTSLAIAATGGTRAAVGTPNAAVRGEVRVWVRSGAMWTEEATLTRNGTGSQRTFATSIAMTADGSRIVVGDQGYGVGSGAGDRAGGVHVFVRTGTSWSLEQTLRAATLVMGEDYGQFVAVAGDGSRLVLGVSRRDVAGVTDVGAAEVWVRSGSTWTREAELTPMGGAMNDAFGIGVAMNSGGTALAVGVPRDSTASGAQAGTVRVFTRSGSAWTEIITLTASGGAANDNFGNPLAFSTDGSRLLVGATSDDTAAGTDAGTVRVFNGPAWTESATISHPSGAANDRFGNAIAVNSDGTYALIGAYADDTASGVDAGSAHLFRRAASWVLDRTLAPAGVAGGDNCGSEVALASDASRGLVALNSDDTTWGTDAGSVRVFGPRPQGSTCTSASECDSNFCVDGVCCNSACGGSTTDCQACTAALTGGVTGTCAPISSGTTCRAATDLCDGPEVCNGSSNSCPAAGPPLPSMTACRPPNGPCDIQEVCNGTTTVCPPDIFASPGTICGSSPGDCATPGMCTGTSAACGSPGVEPAGTMCRASTGPCDLADTCDGVTATCFDRFATTGTACGGAPSGPCDAQDTCSGSSSACASVVAPALTMCRPSTGPCDLVEVCNGATSVCPLDTLQAPGTLCRAGVGPCDVSEFCDGSAACPVDRFLDSDVICRSESGECDLPEYCSGASAGCPGNTLAPPGAVCRARNGLCDVADTCTGLSALCPVDAFADSTMVCRPAIAGGCDTEDRCNGAMPDCPEMVQPTGTVCRATTGACDVTESCDGTSPACPADALVPNGVACGMGSGSCSTPGTCNGSGVSCPGATPLPAGTICQAATPGSECDVDDVCDGTIDACVPRFVAAGTVCGEAPSGPCDVADACTGTSADCPLVFLADVPCRASAGACDLPETCIGDSPNCPADAVASSGTVCMASTDACDPAESCDGASAVCPVNVDMCGGDAGPRMDAGSPGDAGGPLDGGDAGPPVATAGCACRAAHSESPGGWIALAVLGLALARVRHRRGPHNPDCKRER